MSELVHVKGLGKLNELLQLLPAKLEQNVLRGGLRAGAKVVMDEAKRLCPVGPTSMENMKLYGGYEGALRDSIRLSVSAKGGRVTASVKAGGKSKKSKADVYYAHMIEFTGAKPHKITGSHGNFLFIGDHPIKSVMHPGFQAKPFMRPSLDGRAQAALLAAAEYMKKRLATKEGLEQAADVEIAAL